MASKWLIQYIGVLIITEIKNYYMAGFCSILTLVHIHFTFKKRLDSEFKVRYFFDNEIKSTVINPYVTKELDFRSSSIL